jgi:hypothetical protein
VLFNMNSFNVGNLVKEEYALYYCYSTLPMIVLSFVNTNDKHECIYQILHQDYHGIYRICAIFEDEMTLLCK